MKTRNNDQLELLLPALRAIRRRRAGPLGFAFPARRSQQANWWFQQMHKIIDSTPDSSPAPVTQLAS